MARGIDSREYMKVRPTTLEDEASIAVLLEASYGTLLRPDYGAEVLAAAMPFLSRPNPGLLGSGTYYLVLLDERSAGCGGWTREAPATGIVTDGLGYIRHFATHPDFVRRGVAAAVMERCVDQARGAGMRAFRATATLTAIPFYEAQGFSRIGPRVADFGHGVTLHGIEMERAL